MLWSTSGSPETMDLPGPELFSVDYHSARRRFRDNATSAGAILHSYPVDAGSPADLTMDVALLGPSEAPALVVSSGIHGVEGFFGSAVQLALLDQLREPQHRQELRYVLIHALNPFGFAALRRVNEENVDLNRNFVAADEQYAGSPAGYALLDRFLNPASPPGRWDLFHLQACWHLLRRGRDAVKQAVAGGQYDFPRGLFFGGRAPCQSTRIVQQNCATWLAEAQTVMHLDLHTGLGPFGGYKLLLIDAPDSDDFSWYQQTFGAETVESIRVAGGTAYRATGLLGHWLQSHFPARRYRFATAEFGTYGVLPVLKAMRAENRAHHYAPPKSPLRSAARTDLLECFCPTAPGWRRQVVKAGLLIAGQAMAGLAGEGAGKAARENRS